MFDFGWQEMMLVGFVLVMVVGPKDMPKVLRGFRNFTKKAREMAREVTSSFEDLASDEELQGIKSMVTDAKTGNLSDMAKVIDKDDKADLASLGNSIKGEIDEVKDGFKADLQKADLKEAADTDGPAWDDSQYKDASWMKSSDSTASSAEQPAKKSAKKAAKKAASKKAASKKAPSTKAPAKKTAKKAAKKAASSRSNSVKSA